jgi:hypothetical protein
MVAHEKFLVTSYFVQSIEQLDRTGLLVYVPDFMPEASSRPLIAAHVYEPGYDFATLRSKGCGRSWTSWWRSGIKALWFNTSARSLGEFHLMRMRSFVETCGQTDELDANAFIPHSRSLQIEGYI